MNYADELVSMLRPLGVYSFQEGSFSLAELQALGAALDAADEAFGAAQKESIVMTAQDEGLSKMEALFRSKPPAKTVDARRAAIAGFLRISGDSFTLAALNPMPLRVRRCVQRGGNGRGEPGESLVSGGDGDSGRLCGGENHH